MKTVVNSPDFSPEMGAFEGSKNGPLGIDAKSSSPPDF